MFKALVCFVVFVSFEDVLPLRQGMHGRGVIMGMGKDMGMDLLGMQRGMRCMISRNCKMASMKCRYLIWSDPEDDQCPSPMDKLEGEIEKCIVNASQEEDYDKFYESKGKYIKYPAHMFMMMKQKENLEIGEKLQCCALKSQNLVDDEGMINKEKIVEKLMKNAKEDEELAKAVNMGKKMCQPEANCMLMKMQHCFMNACMDALTEGEEMPDIPPMLPPWLQRGINMTGFGIESNMTEKVMPKEGGSEKEKN